MSAIPIPQQEDETDEILKRTGAHAIPVQQPQAPTDGTGASIPTGQVGGGASGSAIPTGNPIHHQAGVASLWSKAENINNPFLRVLGKIGAGFARGIDVAGSIVAPGVAAAIPGSTLNNQVTENRQRKQAEEDTVNQERQAVTQHTQAETGAIPSTTAKTQADTAKEQAETKALGQPKPKEEKWGELPGFTDTDGTPLLHEENSGQVVRANDKKPPTGFKAAKAAVDKPDTPEQQFIDAETSKGVPLQKAVADYAKAAHPPQQEPGSYMPLYDPKTGALTGAWDPKSGHHIAAPNVPGNTSAGAGLQNKATAATDKEAAPYKQMVESAAEAHQLADMASKGNAEADVDLALSFFKMMKGSGGQGIRFTQAEQNFIKGARSSGQDLLGVAQKVMGEGQSFTPEQRKNVVAVIDMHGKAAQQHLDSQGGGAASGGGKENDPLGIR